MALANNALNIYGQTETFFESLKAGQAPEKFTQQHLKDIGFASSNHRAFIPLLKSLGFLSDEGVPTQRYHEYRNDAISRKIMGRALKEAYSDIFIIKANPTENDEELILGKFKSTFNTSDSNAKKMMRTFYSLLALADLEEETNKDEQKEIDKDTKVEDIAKVMDKSDEMMDNEKSKK